MSVASSGWGEVLTAHDIYVRMTGGPGPGALNAARDAAGLEAEREEDRADRIERLAAKIQAGWEGAASAAAQGAAGPLLQAARADAENLRKTQGLHLDQSDVFVYAAGNVLPVPEYPPQSNVLNDMTPWETDLDREIRQYQADVEVNIALYGKYDSASWHHELSLPWQFGTPTDPGGEISVIPPERKPGGPGDGGDPPTPPPPIESRDPETDEAGTDDTGSDDTGTERTGTDETEQRRGPARDTAVEPQASPVTDTSGFVPGPNQPVGGQSTAGTPVGAGAAPFALAGGVASGFGGRGGGAAGGMGAGADGRSGAGAERGGRAGAGAEHGGRAGGVLGEEAGRRGGPGAAGGRAAAGGMGALGGGRGQGGEDDEHNRASYLQEPDPEAIFGTDRAVAPPVIGE